MAIVAADEIKSFAKLTYEDLGYSSDSEFEAFLNDLVDHISGVIENHCRVPAGFFEAGGLSFTDQLYDYRNPLDLRYKPVISVSSVKVNKAGYGQAPDWQTLGSTDYIVDYEAGLIWFVADYPAVQLQSVKVSYTAGYAETPQIVKFVALQLASNILHIILQRKISPVIRVDDWTVRMIIPEAFTAELQAMLDPYVRRVVSVG